MAEKTVKVGSENTKRKHFYVDDNKAERVTVLIVSNDFANTDSPLTNVKNDVVNIKEAFANYSADITFVEAENWTASKILETISYTSPDEPDLFFLFVTTHGDANGLILAQNETFYSTKKVYDAVRSNPRLAKCLKIFVFDNCRGANKETVKALSTEGSAISRRISVAKKLEPTSIPINEYPHNSIILYPTTEGFVSYLSCRGSVLITPFCKAIKNPEDGIDILELITGVQEELCHHVTGGNYSDKVQTPEIAYKARQKLHLRTSDKELFNKVTRNENLYQKCDANHHGGYSAFFKLDSRTEVSEQETSFRNVLEENLHVTIENNKIEAQGDLTIVDRIVKTVDDQYQNQAFVLLVFFGKLVPCEDKSEFCFEKQDIPIHLITSQLIENIRLIEVPKICIFIDEDAVLEEDDSLCSSDSMVSKDGTTPYYVTKHAFAYNIICIGKHDLKNLVRAFRNPDLYDSAKNYNLQFAMAECVRKSTGKTKDNLETIFISTTPYLLNFGKKHYNMLPKLEVNKKALNLVDSNQVLNWTQVTKPFLDKRRNKLWFLIADVGMGKSWFLLQLRNYIRTMEIAKVELVDLMTYYSVPRTATFPELKRVENEIPLDTSETVIILFDKYDKLPEGKFKDAARYLIIKCAEAKRRVLVATKFEQDFEILKTKVDKKGKASFDIEVLALTGYKGDQLEELTKSLIGVKSIAIRDKNLSEKIPTDMKLQNCPQHLLNLFGVLNNEKIGAEGYLFMIYHKGFEDLLASSGQDSANFDQIYKHHLIIAARLANLETFYAHERISDGFEDTIKRIKKHTIGTYEVQRINDVGICYKNDDDDGVMTTDFKFVFAGYKNFFVAVFVVLFIGVDEVVKNEVILDDFFRSYESWPHIKDFIESFRSVPNDIIESYKAKPYSL